jgi:hypothetical protein
VACTVILGPIRGVYWIGEVGLHIKVAVLRYFWTVLEPVSIDFGHFFCSDALFAIGVVCVQRADVLSDTAI